MLFYYNVGVTRKDITLLANLWESTYKFLYERRIPKALNTYLFMCFDIYIDYITLRSKF